MTYRGPVQELHEISMLMGRLLERSDTALDRLEKIESRLQAGDSRMEGLASQIAALDRPKDGPPGWERAVKTVLPYLIGAGVLMGTGSVDSALKIMAAAGK